jgi:hypothetical protein
MALESEQAGKVEESRQYLAARSADDDRATATRLREQVAPRLRRRRHRELAEEAAQRFEARAAEKPRS